MFSRFFTSQFPWISLPFFFTFFLLNIPSTTSMVQYRNSGTDALYDQHCNQIVPKSPLDIDPSSFAAPTPRLQFRNSYFSGGDKIIGQTPGSAAPVSPRYVFLYTLNAHKTVTPGVIKLQASLALRGSTSYFGSFDNSKHRRLRLVRYRGPKTQPWRRRVGFGLDGFWSETSGKVCMVGSGTSLMNSGDLQNLNVVLKLDYPTNVTILHSLITGTLESLNDNSGPQFFEPVSILSLAQGTDYKYTFIDKGVEDCLSGNLRGLNLSQDVCSVIGMLTDTFDLEYESDCDDVNCNPLGKNVKDLPVSMNYEGIECTHEGKLRMLLHFANSSYHVNRYSLVPNDTLVAEGIWDQKENRLCAVVCRILNYTQSLTNASVGDCSIRFSLIFPAVFSIRNRSTVEGQIWSTKSANEPGYFKKIWIRSYNEMFLDPSQIKYEYTEVGAQSSCPQSKNVHGKGKTYPSVNSSDMRFYVSLKNSEGQIARGYASPLFYGQRAYRRFANFSRSEDRETPTALDANGNGLLNISYRISFRSPDFKLAGENFSSKKVLISAEGIYDRNTGSLCMTGCWQRELMKTRILDCQIVVKVQFPSLDASGMDHIQGTIASKRSKSDPFYFDDLELSSVSLYRKQAEESLWRMDLEITMVLISNTLACLFLVLQLFYVNKHPEVLPFVSVLMVIITCLGHMIPLLLNFEALFAAKRNQQSVFLGSGGWLEVNEVIVRVVTMVAFLLQLRLLQLTWSSRQGNTSEKGLWDSEKKVTYLTLPLYAVGISIAWLVYKWRSSYNSSYRPFFQPIHKGYRFLPTRQFGYQQNSFWEVLKSFAGLVLDGFLVPQIIFNLIFDSKEKALSFSFYMGTTFVRLLPHAYDLYRAHHTSRYLDLSYIYANHKLDFYSTAWDIIIPCSGILLALLIFLQQRFGGRCILPRVFRKQVPSYDQVPTISNEEL
ncbi:DUF2921 domain-containing protein [Cucumis melo var. makuwa]|uniref:RING-type E3 ubiquitin transferase n=2 Tax=Cucumis melo TaxID=3656 RepID=A0A5A7UPF1_CUCMM|nr:DUF2921 domain-containing protein [Cucumis melo var. makuwa]TYK26418.1 DUF2921 domain-containing protein [Cucumis melo var. makuwa]